MITVTERFLAEQQKLRSKGIRWDVKATANGETKDLAPYICNDSLSRIEWRIENDLAAFVSSDWQCMLWYDETLWDWLNDNDNIQVEVKCGFSFEKIHTFFGYVDKDYLKKHSLGKIELRVYSFIEYLKSIKTSAVFGGVPSPSYNVPLRDTIESIFDHLELTNQTIQVLPFDTYPNAETYVLSFFAANAGYDGTGELICRITDKKFYYLYFTFFYLITFNDDYTDFTVDLLGHISNPYNIQKWGDDLFAITTGTGQGFYFKDGGSWRYRTDLLATSIIFYDGAGHYLSTQVLSTFTNGSYTYTPIMYGIQKYGRYERYVVYYHGAATANPTQVDRCCFRVYDSGTHAVIHTAYIDDFYKYPRSSNSHPGNQSAIGYYTGRDYYFILLNPTSDFSGNVSVFRLTPVNDQWELFTQTTANPATTYEGRVDCIGEYVCFANFADAYNVKTNEWEADFWSQVDAENKLGRAVRHTSVDVTDPYQIISHYCTSHKVFEIKVMDAEGNITTALDDSTLFPAGYYPLTGFTYWRTYKNVPCMFGMILARNVLSIGLIANRIYPFVKQPPLTDNENLADTIKSLAVAGCCIHHFPDDDTGIFISRVYWDESNVHPINPSMFQKQWQVTRQTPRRIIVTSGSMSVEVGDEVKSLSINSNYIPDHDDDIGKAYAQIYYDFLIAYPFIIDIYTDFLIQFEPFDCVKSRDRTGDEQYQGRLMRVIQEGPRVKFEIRGEEL